MNDTTRLEVQPGVSDFVQRVRARLSDLTEEEREELLGGLEADLSERLAEGETDLGDPGEYAAELRAAAGLGVRRRRGSARPRRPARPLPEQVTELLDAGRTHVDRLVSLRPEAGQAWDVAVVLRPVWWALRAWVAVQLMDLVTGPTEYPTVVPAFSVPGLGPLMLAVAVLLSVQLGRGRLRSARVPLGPVVARVLLLAANGLAVVALVAVLGRFPDAYRSHALANGEVYQQDVSRPEPGLMSGGHYVRNVFAYDASGRPLSGVQLYDQRGRPLDVVQSEDLSGYRLQGRAVQTYPWRNGSDQLWNVFPLPVRRQDGIARRGDAWSGTRPPVVPVAPLLGVPPATLPSAAPTPSTGLTATPTTSPSAGPSPTPSAGPSPTSSANPPPTPSAGPRARASTDSEKPLRR